MFTKIKNWISKEWKDTKLLMKNIPAWVMTFFVVALVMMNLLANKSIDGLPRWLALDAGIIVSWVAFMAMDILVKRFGPKATTKLSIIAICINLCVCGLFLVASIIPGTWGAAYPADPLADLIPNVNFGLNATFGGTWYVLLGSTVAFIVSAIVNNVLNWGIGKAFKKNPDGFGCYACRSYGSTVIGQFVDNLVFALIVSLNFFGWSLLQCITCAITGAVVELLFEIIFSPTGFKIVRAWDKQKIGEEYILANNIDGYADKVIEKEAAEKLAQNKRNEYQRAYRARKKQEKEGK